MLEFPKVREMLRASTGFEPARELLDALVPSGDPDWVAARQAETEEGRSLLERYGEPPADGLRDVRAAVERAARGAVLEGAALREVCAALAAARRIRRFMAPRAQGYPRLAAVAAEAESFPDLEDEIGRCIGDDGAVLDAASPRLAELRRREGDLHARLRERLEALVRAPAIRPYLQEPIVTLRDDRYVLPVKQEHRGQVPGVLHGQSASGATLFIEPLELVDANNELRRLALGVREEEEQVLRRLSGLVGARAAAISATLAAMASLEAILARARLAAAMRAVPPELNDRGIVDLRQARHPLLRGDVVPIDIRLGEEFDTLVITGPNTGGKTVSLKTLGLLVLMAQAGLQIPAAPGSRVAVFRQVFADIGDEQSIEQNLSTFSSHMRNIVAIARSAGPGTLVLLDELGAGTDPAEGAALGMALLEHLQAAGAKTVATTHYSELKAFAYRTPRAENASVEFDVETLAPTYRLVVGLPGRSNAFEIARRLGLEERVVERARRLAGRRHRRAEDVIAGLERERRALAREREAAERASREAEALRREAEERVERLRAKREEILAGARREASAILEEARREAAETVRRLREAAGAAPGREAAALVDAEAARERVNAALRRLREHAEPGPGVLDLPSLDVVGEGQTVYVRSLGRRGTVLRADAGDGDVLVEVGAMRVRVPRSDLAAPPQEAEPAAPAGRGAFQPVALAKAAAVSPEIHLRRLTVDEALLRLDKYLDDALLAGLDEVRIIHGKGGGTLRQAVASYLRTHPAVAEFRLAGPGEGGHGVTVARLRAR